MTKINTFNSTEGVAEVKTKLALFTVMVLLVGALGLLAIIPVAAQDQEQTTMEFECGIGFQAGVYYGPSTGLFLDGQLVFNLLDDGGIEGYYVSLDQTVAYEMSGQVNGRAVNLMFDLGDGKYVYGVGTAKDRFDGGNCGTQLGGPLVGSEPGDMGDWETVQLVCNPLIISTGRGTIIIEHIRICSEAPASN